MSSLANSGFGGAALAEFGNDRIETVAAASAACKIARINVFPVSLVVRSLDDMRSRCTVEDFQIRNFAAIDGRYSGIDLDETAAVKHGDPRQARRMANDDPLGAIGRQQIIQLSFDWR